MKVLLILAFVTFAAAQQKYVWDYLKPALTAEEVMNIMAQKNQFPMYNTIPETAFDCNSKKQPGFYADTETQCQVFHRCDVNGNLTSYICVNSTVFNQITLVCDYWFNVDCSRSQELENFANERLYTEKDLFDTPPADYVIPGTAGAEAASPIVTPVKKPAAAKPAAPAKPAPAKAGAQAGGSAQAKSGTAGSQAGANAQGQNTLTVAVISPQAADASSNAAASTDEEQPAE